MEATRALLTSTSLFLLSTTSSFMLSILFKPTAGVKVSKSVSVKLMSLILFLSLTIRYGDFLETSLANEDILSFEILHVSELIWWTLYLTWKESYCCIRPNIPLNMLLCFSNVFGQTSKELWKSYPSVWLRIFTKNRKIIVQYNQKEETSETISTLSDKASRSFGISFCKDNFAFQLKLIIEQICFIEEQILLSAGNRTAYV